MIKEPFAVPRAVRMYGKVERQGGLRKYEKADRT